MSSLCATACTAERCAALAMFEDTGALKANLKVRAFDTYVTRYASAWNKQEPAADKEPQTSSVTPAPVANAAEPSVAHPLDPQIRFPFGRLDSGGQHHEC